MLTAKLGKHFTRRDALSLSHESPGDLWVRLQWDTSGTDARAPLLAAATITGITSGLNGEPSLSSEWLAPEITIRNPRGSIFLPGIAPLP